MRSLRSIRALAVSVSILAATFVAAPQAVAEVKASGVTLSGQVWAGDKAHERPTWGSKDAPGFAQGKRPTVNGKSWSSVPIVATNKDGKAYDKRNGQLLSADNAAAATKWQEGYDAPSQKTLITGDTGEKSAGATFDAGGLHVKDGQQELASGKLGTVNLDAASATAQANGSAGIAKGGVQAQGHAEASVTLVGLSAESKTAQLGDPDGLTNASASASGQAAVVADGSADGYVGINKHGAGGAITAEAFAGGKASADGNATVSICGVQVDLQGEAEASYGIGAKASGQFAIDWAKMTVKIGGSAALTVGGGAGAGGTMEISLAKVVKDPRAAAQCVAKGLADAKKFVAEKGGQLAQAAGQLAGKGIEKLGEGVHAVESGLSNAGSAVATFFGFGSHQDPGPTAAQAVATRGNNTGRNSNTVPTPLGGASRPGASGTSASHGVAR